MDDVSGLSDSERSEVCADCKVSDRRVEEVLNSIGEGFFTLGKDLVVTYFNKAAGKLLGRDPQEVIGKRLFEEAFPEGEGTILD